MEKKKINLSVITEALDEKMEDWQQFYNIRTGEVETIPDFDFIDRSDYEELIDKIENNFDEWIHLPSRYDIHEYNIMERFADLKGSYELRKALQMRKPFRHFKDVAIRIGLIDEYYTSKSEELRKIARSWCINHEIPFEE